MNKFLAAALIATAGSIVVPGIAAVRPIPPPHDSDFHEAGSHDAARTEPALDAGPTAPIMLAQSVQDQANAVKGLKRQKRGGVGNENSGSVQEVMPETSNGGAATGGGSGSQLGPQKPGNQMPKEVRR